MFSVISMTKKGMRGKGALRCVFLSAFLSALACLPAQAAAPAILLEQEPHVGEEVVLSVAPASVPSNATLEWVISGDVNPILLRAGGRECAFTPRNTQPIVVRATLRDQSGNPLGESDKTLNPKEFLVEISVIADEPVKLWDPIEKKDVPAGALLAGRPVRLRAKLTPPFRGAHSFEWTADASTALLDGDVPSDSIIRRSETGDSEVRVTAFNAAGLRLGEGSTVISVTLPTVAFSTSERSREAWQNWQRAQSLWGEGKHAEAVKLSQQAQAAAPRDPDILNGVKAMTTNYARLLRAADFRKKSEEQRGKGLFDESLKSLRLAQVVWPTAEGTKGIQDLEKKIDELRVQRQKADWLRDTASAYDQEGLFEDAMDYYAQSAAVLSSDAIADRMARIKNRLALMSEADRYAGEGSALEREGQLQEAINHYSASIMSNPDTALKQHIAELQDVIAKRKRQSTALYREGMDLQRKGSGPEALQRFRESQRMWASSDAQQRTAELEKTVSSNAPLRGPEDFGIGTSADAARIVKNADSLYLQGRLEEAAALYRKSLAIAPGNAELRAWIGELEGVLRERKNVQAANVLIRQGNALFKAGKR